MPFECITAATDGVRAGQLPPEKWINDREFDRDVPNGPFWNFAAPVWRSFLERRVA